MEAGSRELHIKSNSILDDYEVYWNQKLGCGISGPVRPCMKKGSGQRFALKCLVDKPRSRREVALHFKCGAHAHIVDVYDCYANEVQFAGENAPRSRLLLVMELMDGGELFDRISKQKYFTESQASRYTKQISEAIKKCHSLNIAHRDIKPENLLLKDNSENAVIKLSDFGFAKEDDGSLQTPHFTPYYVAPQILEAQTKQIRQAYHIIADRTPYTYDKSCDMWSLGVIVYIMLCGYPPFYSETPTKQITKNMKKKIMAGEYEFPQEDWSHISPHAKDLVKRLLTVAAHARLTVEQVLEHPWLYEAPHTQLNSPAVMLDQHTFLEASIAHSAQLTAMRMPDQQLRLKPIGQVNNPILRKRLHSRVSVEGESGDQPPNKSPALDVNIEALRDIIAHCFLPPKGLSEEQHTARLESLVTRACQCYHDNPTVSQVFTQHGWTGASFKDKVNRQSLALTLSELVQRLIASAVTLETPSTNNGTESTATSQSATNHDAQSTVTSQTLSTNHAASSTVTSQTVSDNHSNSQTSVASTSIS